MKNTYPIVRIINSWAISHTSALNRGGLIMRTLLIIQVQAAALALYHRTVDSGNVHVLWCARFARCSCVFSEAVFGSVAWGKEFVEGESAV